MIRDLKYNFLPSSVAGTARQQLAVPGTIEQNAPEKSTHSKVPGKSYSQLSGLEIAFLKKHIGNLQANIDKELAPVESEACGWDALPWHRRQRLEVYERESEILLEILDRLKQNSHRLADVMAERLGRLSQTAAPGRPGDGSEATYWETNLERQIVVQLLAGWWRWLKAKP